MVPRGVLLLLLLQLTPCAAQNCPNLGGVIAGCILGTLALCCIIGGIIFLVLWWRRKRRQPGVKKDNTDIEVTGGAAGYDNKSFEDDKEWEREQLKRRHHRDGGKGMAGYVECREMELPVSKVAASRNDRSSKRLSFEDGLSSSRHGSHGSHGSLDNTHGTTRVFHVPLQSEDIIGLGFNIAGSMSDGIFISQVHNRGPAIESGKVHTGDRILSINISFKNMVYEDALTILSYASPYPVILELERSSTLYDSREDVGGDAKIASSLKHPLYRSHSADDLTKIGKQEALLIRRARSEMKKHKRGDSLNEEEMGEGTLRKWKAKQGLTFDDDSRDQSAMGASLDVTDVNLDASALLAQVDASTDKGRQSDSDEDENANKKRQTVKAQLHGPSVSYSNKDRSVKVDIDGMGTVDHVDRNDADISLEVPGYKPPAVPDADTKMSVDFPAFDKSSNTNNNASVNLSGLGDADLVVSKPTVDVPSHSVGRYYPGKVDIEPGSPDVTVGEARMDISGVNVDVPDFGKSRLSVDTPDVNVEKSKVYIDDKSKLYIDKPDFEIESPKVSVNIPHVDKQDVSVDAPKVDTDLSLNVHHESRLKRKSDSLEDVAVSPGDYTPPPLPSMPPPMKRSRDDLHLTMSPAEADTAFVEYRDLPDEDKLDILRASYEKPDAARISLEGPEAKARESGASVTVGSPDIDVEAPRLEVEGDKETPRLIIREPPGRMGLKTQQGVDIGADVPDLNKDLPRFGVHKSDTHGLHREAGVDVDLEGPKVGRDLPKLVIQGRGAPDKDMDMNVELEGPGVERNLPRMVIRDPWAPSLQRDVDVDVGLEGPKVHHDLPTMVIHDPSAPGLHRDMDVSVEAPRLEGDLSARDACDLDTHAQYRNVKLEGPKVEGDLPTMGIHLAEGPHAERAVDTDLEGPKMERDLPRMVIREPGSQGLHRERGVDVDVEGPKVRGPKMVIHEGGKTEVEISGTDKKYTADSQHFTSGAVVNLAGPDAPELKAEGPEVHIKSSGVKVKDDGPVVKTKKKAKTESLSKRIKANAKAAFGRLRGHRRSSSSSSSEESQKKKVEVGIPSTSASGKVELEQSSASVEPSVEVELPSQSVDVDLPTQSVEVEGGQSVEVEGGAVPFCPGGLSRPEGDLSGRVSPDKIEYISVADPQVRVRNGSGSSMGIDVESDQKSDDVQLGTPGARIDVDLPEKSSVELQKPEFPPGVEGDPDFEPEDINTSAASLEVNVNDTILTRRDPTDTPSKPPEYSERESSKYLDDENVQAVLADYFGDSPELASGFGVRTETNVKARELEGDEKEEEEAQIDVDPQRRIIIHQHDSDSDQSDDLNTLKSHLLRKLEAETSNLEADDSPSVRATSNIADESVVISPLRESERYEGNSSASPTVSSVTSEERSPVPYSEIKAHSDSGLLDDVDRIEIRSTRSAQSAPEPRTPEIDRRSSGGLMFSTSGHSSGSSRMQDDDKKKRPSGGLAYYVSIDEGYPRAPVLEAPHGLVNDDRPALIRATGTYDLATETRSDISLPQSQHSNDTSGSNHIGEEAELESNNSDENTQQRTLIKSWHSEFSTENGRGDISPVGSPVKDVSTDHKESTWVEKNESMKVVKTETVAGPRGTYTMTVTKETIREGGQAEDSEA